MWVSADGRRQWKGFRERWMFLLWYRQAIIFPQNIGILFKKKKKNNPKEKLGTSGQIKWRTERGRDPSLDLCSVSFRTWCPHRAYWLPVSPTHWATPLSCTNSSPASVSPLRGLFPRPNSHPQINLLQGDKADYNSVVCVHAQSCLTLCDPMDSSPQAPLSVQFSLARILQQVAISHSRGSSLPRDWTGFSGVSCIGRCILYHCAILEAPNSSLLCFSNINLHPTPTVCFSFGFTVGRVGSLTSNQTHTPAVEAWSLSRLTTREVPITLIFYCSS